MSIAVAVRATLVLAITTLAVPLQAQRLLERSPNLPNSVTTMTGSLELSTPTRFRHFTGAGLQSGQTLDLSLGLPLFARLDLTTGVRFAALSDVVAEGSNEWEIYDRLGLLRQGDNAGVDVNLTGAYNFMARSVDGEASLARRFGSLRVIAAARALSAAYESSAARFAGVAGAVWHVSAGHMPVTLAGDVAVLTDRAPGELVAWSGGVQVGVPHSQLVLSLQASNTTTTTMQGASRGGGTRWGFELNAPITFPGLALGWYATRERTRASVTEDADGLVAARVRISGYLYGPMTVRVRAGDTVEWVNDDAVVHTVTAEHRGFDSGAIDTGETWRARFDAPGRYPYYCGPHPFMKGLVIVTAR